MAARVFLILVFLNTLIFSCSSTSQDTTAEEKIRVQINATDDTITLRFIRPHTHTHSHSHTHTDRLRLQGYVLGYGGSMFSKQYIELPKDGQPYYGEMDAEPKYLIAVQPIKPNVEKKPCPNKVNLKKPLHLVIGSITPTKVMLSWGTFLNTPYTHTNDDDCPQDGQYTIRYREQDPQAEPTPEPTPESTPTPTPSPVPGRDWTYQPCPSKATVIERLKPNTPYEFEVRADTEERSGDWSPRVVHNTNASVSELTETISTHPRPHNTNPNASQAEMTETLTTHPRPHTTNANTSVTETLVSLIERENKDIENPFKAPVVPLIPKVPVQPKPGRGDRRWPPPRPRPSVTPAMGTRRPYPGPAPFINRPRPPAHRNSTLSSRKPDASVEGMQGVTLTKPAPKPHNGSSLFKQPRPGKYEVNQVVNKNPEEKDKVRVNDLKRVDLEPAPKPTDPPTSRRRTTQTPPTTTTTTTRTNPAPRTSPRITYAPPTTSTSTSTSSTRPPRRPTTRSTEPPKPANQRTEPPKPANQRTEPPKPANQRTERPKPANRRIQRPRPTPPTTTTTTQAPVPRTTPLAYLNEFESGENSSVFSSEPTSDVDAMGNKRFTAPHVVYQTDKGPEEPCSVTRTLSHFPDDEAGEVNVTAPPRNPPSNVTVVAVEGCPSFVIIGWDKSDNETTAYEVTSSTKGPEGKEVSVLVTNKTHTAVENLNPESSYQFTVTPKNELGTGPSSDPVSFRTESVDPRVAEVTGKRAIWSTYPFQLDMVSECTGPQYIKRTWYRKFVGIQLCNSLRYKIYLSDSLKGPFYHIGDQSGHGEDHCQFVDSLLDGRTGTTIPSSQLPETQGFYRAVRQEPVSFGTIGGHSHINYVSWYECGVSIPGKW